MIKIKFVFHKFNNFIISLNNDFTYIRLNIQEPKEIICGTFFKH
jgi:hypothetical protein